MVGVIQEIPEGNSLSALRLWFPQGWKAQPDNLPLNLKAMMPTAGQCSQATKPGFPPWPEGALQPAAAVLAGPLAVSVAQTGLEGQAQRACAGPQLCSE